jgi:hypothetical protein
MSGETDEKFELREALWMPIPVVILILYIYMR